MDWPPSSGLKNYNGFFLVHLRLLYGLASVVLTPRTSSQKPLGLYKSNYTWNRHGSRKDCLFQLEREPIPEAERNTVIYRCEPAHEIMVLIT